MQADESLSIAAGAAGAVPVARPVPVRVGAAAGEARQTVRRILFAADDRARAQRDALFVFGVRVASAAILYVSQAILARWMGTHEYGVFVFVWTWMLVLGGLSALGFAGASLRLVPEYRETGRSAPLRGLVRGGPALACLVGTLVAATGIGGILYLGDQLGGPYALPACLILVCLPLYALEDAMDGVARGHGWMGLALVPPFVLRPLLLLAGMGLAYAAGWPMTAVTAAAVAIAAVWLAALVQLAVVARRLRATASEAAPKYDFRAWLAVSLPLVLVYACELAMQNTDILVISRFMSPADVGIYFAAAKTMSLINFVQYAVGSAVAARFSALKARGDEAGLATFAGDAARWMFWPSLAGAVVILALGKPLLALFGPEFVSAYPVMFVLVLGFLVRSAVGPADILLNMLGEHRLCAALLAVMAVVNVALNLVLVPRFGLIGAASATAAALALGALMSYLAARRRLGLDCAIWGARTS